MLDVEQECFISETERGNWTVEVKLDCIITTTGEGEVIKNNTVEDKMFTQLRPYRNLTVGSGQKTQVMIWQETSTVWGHWRLLKVRGPSICDKICLGYCYYLWFFKWIRRKKRQEDGGKIKSHTQTHPRRPTLTKNNHLLALTLHAWPKLQVQHNTTAFEPDQNRAQQSTTENAPRHSPRRPQDTEQRRRGGGG